MRDQGSAGAVHTRDEDCDVDPATLCCRGCGVDHGGECRSCSGHGFHREGCPEMDPEND